MSGGDAAGYEPFVTVVVPCRNRASYVRATIDSILAQEYPNLECIVVDGASTDGTIDILRSYGNRIRWVSEPDSGPFEAITKGWALGHGDVLAWLNADDTWEPGAVATAAAVFAAAERADVVYGAALGVDAGGRVRYLFAARPFDTQDAILHCDHTIMQAASFVRRRAVESVGGLYPAWTHDQELWLRIGLAGGRLVGIPSVLARIRISADDAHVDPAVMVPARLAMMHRVLALPSAPAELRRRERRVLSNTYLRGLDGLRVARRAHWAWGGRCLWGAVRTDPPNGPHVVAEVLRLVRARLRPRVGAGR